MVLIYFIRAIKNILHYICATKCFEERYSLYERTEGILQYMGYAYYRENIKPIYALILRFFILMTALRIHLGVFPNTSTVYIKYYTIN